MKKRQEKTVMSEEEYHSSFDDNQVRGEEDPAGHTQDSDGCQSSGEEYQPSLHSSNDGSLVSEKSLNSIFSGVEPPKGVAESVESSPKEQRVEEKRTTKPRKPREERTLKGAPNMGVARKREGRRPKRPCPVQGCHATPGNLKEHLFFTACH
ncbi:uncharacterized protein LOC135489252 isoform X2 [Lineus longissimus]|uniref:uncharacterized protein LOC135489252 isoform X2 n=1 Tax=Lineus longissimus TaxID=88925 RepID=UPI002B4F2987